MQDFFNFRQRAGPLRLNYHQAAWRIILATYNSTLTSPVHGSIEGQPVCQLAALHIAAQIFASKNKDNKLMFRVQKPLCTRSYLLLFKCF